MNIVYFLAFISSIFASNISTAENISAADIDLGQLYTIERKFKINLADCERVWVIESKTIASCHVEKFLSEHTFLLSTNTLILKWTYFSEQNWKIHITVRHTPLGYKIQLLGGSALPADRLQFNVAQKYIESAFENNNLSIGARGDEFFSVAMKTKPVVNAFEKILGKTTYAKRSLNLDKLSVRERCKVDIVKNSNGYCIVPLTDNASGEVTLTRQKFSADIFSENKLNELKFKLYSDSEWLALGLFSLAYLRVDFKGEYNPAIFDKLYSEATSQYGAKVFNIYTQIAVPTNNSPFYDQVNLGDLGLSKRQINFNIKDCEKFWLQESQSGFCMVKVKWPSPRVGSENTLIEERANIGSKSAFLIFRVSSEGYSAHIYGFERFLDAKPFIEKIMGSQPKDKLFDYALKLPVVRVNGNITEH